MKARLETVTFTGVDDAVDPIELLKISSERPYIEWGVLFGNKVKERFPSPEWIRDLVALKKSHQARWPRPLNLAAHLCGQYIDKLNDGINLFEWKFHDVAGAFSRIQYNTHKSKISLDPNALHDVDRFGHNIDNLNFKRAIAYSDSIHAQYIIPVNDVNDSLNLRLARDCNAHVLFDASHGNGVPPLEWPKPPKEIFAPNWAKKVGFAGGLSPDNISTEIIRIEKALFRKSSYYHRYWVDMETGVRTAGKFDLDKVNAVLEVLDSYASEDKSFEYDDGENDMDDY